MRSIVLAAVAVLGASTAAYAGEGNGEPFAANFAGVTTTVDPRTMTMRDQDPYQYRISGPAATMGNYKPMSGASQDPYPFRSASRVITFQPAQTATASVASPASIGQGIAAPHG